MNSKNSGTSNPHRLLLSLTDKINLRRRDKYVALSDLILYINYACIIHEKIFKSYTKIKNLKYQLQHGMKSLN